MVYTIPGIRLHVLPSSSFHCGSDRRSVIVAASNSSNLSFLLRKNSLTRKFLAGRSAYESESPSFVVSATEKGQVLAPGDGSSSTDQLEAVDADNEDSNISQSESDEEQLVDMTEKDFVTSAVLVEDIAVTEEEPSETILDISKESEAIRQISIPPPGAGQRIYEIDPLLTNHREHLEYRYSHYKKIRESIDKYEGGLEAFSRGYEKLGFTRSDTGITYREWAPGAKSASLIGDFNNWNQNADVMTRNEFGVWEIFLPNNADNSPPIPHGSRVKIRMDTPSGLKDSIPAWIKFSVQAPGEIPYNGIYYDPPEEEKYVFQHPRPKKPKSLRIYEAHVGMSCADPVINTYANFRDDVLPRIKKLAYNAVQVMAIQEHSYYASFGVSDLRVVDLLEGLCDKMQDYTLQKMDSNTRTWIKVDDWDDITSNKQEAHAHSKEISSYCGRLLEETENELAEQIKKGPVKVGEVSKVLCQDLSQHCKQTSIQYQLSNDEDDEVGEL